ncbi:MULTISPECIES: hypothetical protein [Emticicia]|uniref:hypothetical protein n=1 Tax=Emticicia TaxID=312278 RepID=UPI001E535C66|nr:MULTISPECIES: hypothetical protein [Emticicia]
MSQNTMNTQNKKSKIENISKSFAMASNESKEKYMLLIRAGYSLHFALKMSGIY